MRFPRTIGFRITLGFGLIIIAIIINVVLSQRIVSRIQTTQQEVSNILEPSIRQLIELRDVLHQSKDLAQTWGYSERDAGSPILHDLRYNFQNQLPAIHQQILHLSNGWRQRDREDYNDFYLYINDSLYHNTTQFTSNLYPTDQSDTMSSGNLTRLLMGSFEFADRELDDLIARFDRLVIQSSEKTEGVYQQTLNVLLITGIIIILAAILIAILLYLALANPIRQYADAIKSMGKGVIPENEFREGTDEMGQIGTALNSMIKGLRDLSVFAEEIGKGNFKSKFTPLSDKDTLGNSLIQLREDLQNAGIEEVKRKREDERRNWSNHGIARFSEILREYSGSSEDLANKLISELVNYLGARVGGIFLIRAKGDSPGDIELIASYAYDRTKHIKKTIQSGEGLVGRCVQEGSTIFLTEIPKDYIKIKSGLGQDNPKSLLIVPIRLTEIIIGVIEIASLEIIQDFQIEFVERIGSTIASSLSGEHAGSSPTKNPA
ncbi:MAG TPA: HAMP domain-containing protein [Bacteroides sp.]|nr:HAMP domain-containing protein [Bacteroides sp.]